MQYREFGKLDWKVSALGFGAMRLPVIGGNQAKINELEAIRIMRYAIDNGVNYLDTAYVYHLGQSERVVGIALQDGYRDRVKLATKLPPARIASYEDFDRVFAEQLTRLQTDKIDFYLLHGLNAKNWPKLRDLGALRWAENQIARGRIGYLGFSFHDSYEVFKGILNDYGGWTFCQLQYNYMDVDNQAGRRGVELAAGRDMGVIVMEPLLGGKLAGKPPEAVARLWETAARKRPPVAWGLLWVWNQPEISLALSGMSTMPQVVENIAIAAQAEIGLLKADELGLIDRVRETFRGLSPIPCTACRYCLPCPNGVDIPTIFKIYNETMAYNDLPKGRLRYQRIGSHRQHSPQPAPQCQECGQCLETCPQKIDIPDWLKKVAAALGH